MCGQVAPICTKWDNEGESFDKRWNLRVLYLTDFEIRFQFQDRNKKYYPQFCCAHLGRNLHAVYGSNILNGLSRIVADVDQRICSGDNSGTM